MALFLFKNLNKKAKTLSAFSRGLPLCFIVRNAKKVFEMSEHCGLDLYNVLDDLQYDVEEEKEILGKNLENFYWLNGKLTETEEFKKMNEIYKKALKV